MPTQLTIPFTIPNWKEKQSLHIVTVGETVWSVRPEFDTYDGDGWIEVSRSIGNDEVEFYIEVRINTFCILGKCGELLSDGQKNIRFDCCIFKRNMDYALEGDVILRYKSNCVLTSKKEAITQTEKSISTQAKVSTPSTQLVSDLLQLLDNPDSFSDATLACGTAQIPVHRGILSSRSPVFAAMFKTQMQEGREGIVDIVDMEPDVLQVMLRYVYSGQSDHLTHSMAGDLLFAADKYQLEELKLICVEKLKVSMAANNVFGSVVLGELHDDSLKAHALEFICKHSNFSDLDKTEEWQSLLMERPLLAVEVATTALKYLQNK